MKLITNIVRVIVGVLFIFSGLVKANDPNGLSYKMKEFFEVWNGDLATGSFFLKNSFIHFFDFLHEHSLFLSVLMISFEIIAGAALLLGWRIKLFSWLLLLLIVFFTFLTGYAVLSTHPDGSPKFTNCGCFGDCIPISSQFSFTKDIILTILIVFLFWQRKKIQPLFSNRTNLMVMLGVTVFTLLIQWYALHYLPFKDCLPFKKGNNILKKRLPPPGAVQDSFAIQFLYEKDGKQYEFSMDDLAKQDLKQFHFVKRIQKLVRKGNARPEINSFYLREGENDSTEAVLQKPAVVILFMENMDTPFSGWINDFKKINASAAQKNIPVYVVTADNAAEAAIQKQAISNITLLRSDATGIRTAARVNPTLYFIKNAVVVNKWSYKKMNEAISQINP